MNKELEQTILQRYTDDQQTYEKMHKSSIFSPVFQRERNMVSQLFLTLQIKQILVMKRSPNCLFSLQSIFSEGGVGKTPQVTCSRLPFLPQLSELAQLPNFLPFDSAFLVLAVDIQADLCISEHFFQLAVCSLSSMRMPH